MNKASLFSDENKASLLLRNKSELVLATILSIFLIVLVWFVYQGNSSQPNLDKPQATANLSQDSYQSLSDDQGEVVVSVQPMALKSGNPAKFSVKIDTHSVNLDFDIKNLSVLTDNTGQTLKAISWSGGRGGHHLSGELDFPPLPNKTTSVKLTILQIANVDRVFKWNIKG